MEFLELPCDLESRYDRHSLIEWWDQSKLKTAKVLVAGTGALGNEVIKNLALLGVGHITIIDFDTVSITNLTRSVLFRESDVGLPKVEVARQRALEINPEISILAIHGDLEFDLGIGDVCEHDIIIGCLDSVNARWAINQLAYRAGIPWINAGIGVAEGEVSFFDPKTEAACYECTISEQMWKRRNQRYSCQGMKRHLPEMAMPTTAPIASITAAMQVQQALLYLHGKTGLLNAGEKIFLGLNPWTAFKLEIQRKEDCLAHDLSIEPQFFFNSDPTSEVKNILMELVNSGFDEPVLWLRNEIINTVQCPNCSHQETINFPLRKYLESQLSCPSCQHEPRDFEVIRYLTLSNDSPQLVLGDLCLTQNEILHCETKNGQIAIQFRSI
ncbi:HesA/MoeB/ThiF family protein [Planktothrix agardhii]|uniref:HesA/MoeB/ThiF family protein n=1 Tax=Planktothrix agardhii TaxID=1160 RepID=UPI0020A761AF|nr:ThiF family adenylyltransferase [Planktothrix agardhii]CAD5977758.1 Molybdopterin-synthase adenylyltransferase [Planktothrix agardhii]